mmetsp:Transcript_94379/g.215943  ORF Transcript_94379/g.215943 Transcript_94379/m.215943 type:complete len:253 (+) Transcript_94379:103-861(+)
MPDPEESSSDSSDGEDAVAAFEARMAAEGDQGEDDVLFSNDAVELLSSDCPSMDMDKGLAGTRKRTWDLLRTRWATDQEVLMLTEMEGIINTAAEAVELGKNKETTEAMGLVRWDAGRIFIGSDAHAKDVPQLVKSGVKAVLCVHDTKLSEKRLRLYSEANIQVMQVPMMDSLEEDLSKHLDTTNAFFEEWLGQGAVLVHCHIGQNRSAAVAIAYMMKRGIPLMDAVRMAAEGRGYVLASGAFPLQLIRVAV